MPTSLINNTLSGSTRSMLIDLIPEFGNYQNFSEGGGNDTIIRDPSIPAIGGTCTVKRSTSGAVQLRFASGRWAGIFTGSSNIAGYDADTLGIIGYTGTGTMTVCGRGSHYASGGLFMRVS